MPTTEGGWNFIGGGLGTLEADSGPTVRTYLHDEQMWVDKPLAGPPFTDVTGHVWASQWHHDRYIADVKRNVESCDHRLAHLDDPWSWWQGEPPASEQVERRRAEIESEKAGALAELKRLEPAKGTKARGTG